MALALTLPLLFGAGEVPRRGDAGAQLAYARAQKQAMMGLDGAARERARTAAIDAYRAVREHHPRVRAAVAEAAFRAGELLRAGERLDDARVEFRVAAAEGRGTEFRARARLELGHLERREGRANPALDEYLAVVADEESCPHHRDCALLWSGRVYADLKRDGEARRAWERVALHGEDPVDRVRAFDELGCLWVRRGDAEAAAGELARCRAELFDEAQEQTETGARVRAALESMRTLRRLREVARRRAEQARERRELPEHPPDRDRGPKKSRSGARQVLDNLRARAWHVRTGLDLSRVALAPQGSLGL
jgi:tetratricopeptide (TPR) repeat protein